MKVGITFSTFDILDTGYVKMLEKPKRQCDYLIVWLQLGSSNRFEKNAPSQSIIKRYIQLKRSKHTDKIKQRLRFLIIFDSKNQYNTFHIEEKGFEYDQISK